MLYSVGNKDKSSLYLQLISLASILLEFISSYDTLADTFPYVGF